MDDDEIRTLMTRLGRRHPSGGKVVERAAILAEGCDVAAVLAWIDAHGGVPEAIAPPTSGRGLFADREDRASAERPQTPARFVLPPGALDAPPSVPEAPPAAPGA